jgi:hypothetical protein
MSNQSTTAQEEFNNDTGTTVLLSSSEDESSLLILSTDSADKIVQVQDDYAASPNLNNLSSSRRILIRRMLLGGLLGGFLSVCTILILQVIYEYPSPLLSATTLSNMVCPQAQQQGAACGGMWLKANLPVLRGSAPTRTTVVTTGVGSYPPLFGRGDGATKNVSSSSSTTLLPTAPKRKLKLAIESTWSRGPELVIAGKMTVEEGPCNIAQLNLKSKEWSITQRIQLSLYNSYSGGEVYGLLANHTYQRPSKDDDVDDRRYV